MGVTHADVRVGCGYSIKGKSRVLRESRKVGHSDLRSWLGSSLLETVETRVQSRPSPLCIRSLSVVLRIHF